MFEKARLAARKAAEHLESAEVLARAGFFAQAYAHVELALEESAVFGVRMITEGGAISWSSPPPWFKWKESDLARPGTHRDLLRLGLVFATILSGMRSVAPQSSEVKAAEVVNAVLTPALAKLMGSLPRLLSNPALLDLLRNGDRRKMAAFYSSPWRPAPVPTEADFREIVQLARPLISALKMQWPTKDEMIEFLPLAQQLTALTPTQFEAKKSEIRTEIERELLRKH